MKKSPEDVSVATFEPDDAAWLLIEETLARRGARPRTVAEPTAVEPTAVEPTGMLTLSHGGRFDQRASTRRFKELLEAGVPYQEVLDAVKQGEDALTELEAAFSLGSAAFF